MNTFKWLAIFIGIWFCACSNVSSKKMIVAAIENEKEIETESESEKNYIGEEGYPCIEERGCYSNLVCRQGLCVAACITGEEGCPCIEGRGCYSDLICNQKINICFAKTQEIDTEPESIEGDIDFIKETEYEVEYEKESIVEIEPEEEPIIEIEEEFESEVEPIIEIETEAEAEIEAEPIIEIEAEPEIELICLNNADGLEIPGDGIDQNCVGFDRTPQIGDCFFAPNRPNGTGTMEDPTSNFRNYDLYCTPNSVYWFAVGDYVSTTGILPLNGRAIIGGRDPITWRKATEGTTNITAKYFAIFPSDVVYSSINLKVTTMYGGLCLTDPTIIQKIIIVDSTIYSSSGKAIDLRDCMTTTRLTLLRNNFQTDLPESSGGWIFYVNGITTIDELNACNWIGCIRAEGNISSIP